VLYDIMCVHMCLSLAASFVELLPVLHPQMSMEFSVSIYEPKWQSRTVPN